MDRDADSLDVRHAAAAVGRHPETIRRWVWSGQLAARREGRRLLVRRAEVEALAGITSVEPTLAGWARAVRETRAGRAGATRATASDLILEDRRKRSDSDRNAGR